MDEGKSSLENVLLVGNHKLIGYAIAEDAKYIIP